MRGYSLPFLTRFRRFKKIFWKKMNKMCQIQQILDCLYSVEHIIRFFHMIVIHTAVSINRSFNFILTNRKNNHVESDFDYYLFRFMPCEKNYQIFYNALIIFITSSIMLNAYFSKMHNKTILILTNTNVQHLIKIRRLRYENDLWCSILTFLFSIFYWNIWWSQFCLTSKHLHSQSIDSISFFHDRIQKVTISNALKENDLSWY